MAVALVGVLAIRALGWILHESLTGMGWWIRGGGGDGAGFAPTEGKR